MSDKRTSNAKNTFVAIGSDVEDSEEFGGSDSHYFQTTSPTLQRERSITLADEERSARTPPRVQSSNSLFGEGLLQSIRLPTSAASSHLVPRYNNDGMELSTASESGDVMRSPYVEDQYRGEQEESDDQHDLVFSPDLSPSRASEVTTPPSVVQPTLSPPRLVQQQPHNNQGANHSLPDMLARNPRTRPPRAPHHQRSISSNSPGAIRPGHHIRAASHGDSSFMSALTDASSEQQHRRGVSWGGTEYDPDAMNIGDMVHLQQPILLDDPKTPPMIPDDLDDETILKTPQDEAKQRIESAEKDQSKADIEDLMEHVCEYEAEAETQILKAIEDEIADKNMGSIPKIILPDLPETVVSTFDNESGSAENNSPPSEMLTSVIRLLALQRAVSKNLREDETQQTTEKRHPQEEETPRNAREELAANAARLMNIMSTSYQSSKEGKRRQQNEAKDAEELNSTDDNGLEEAEAGQANNRFAFFARNARRLGAHLPPRLAKGMVEGIKDIRHEWDLFGKFLAPRRSKYIEKLRLLLVIAFPSLLVAAILFYGTENPPTGKHGEARLPLDPSQASASWWLLFLGVRHMLVLGLAQATELVICHFLTLSSVRFTMLVGPRVTLFLAAGKGWPATMLFYGAYALILLSGNDKLARHWLFWQNGIGLFNAENPAGDVTHREVYIRFLGFFVFLGFSSSLKRLWLGHHLGRRLLVRYRDDVQSVVRKMYLIGEVGALSMSAPTLDRLRLSDTGSFEPDSSPGLDTAAAPEEASGYRGSKSAGHTDPFVDSDRVEKPTIMSHLVEWNEPERAQNPQHFSAREIFEFQQAIRLIQEEYVFSLAFGVTINREACVRSASNVFDRLISRSGSTSDNVPFSTIAELAVDSRSKLKELKAIFQPNRDGVLSRVNFVKCVDVVYRELRVLAANIDNAATIDKAYEAILDVAFWALIFVFALPIIGIDPFSFILSLSSIIISFAFMIGSASSSYFEGILLIIVRRPYEIGDRIAVSNIDQDTSTSGSNGWIVEKIDLFSTTVRYGMTREVATLSNGSLARSRIINMRRSDQAQVMVHLKFGVDASYQKIKVLKKSVKRFVSDRVQEWVEMTSFRSTRVEADLGYVEYVIVLKHRESWQQTLAIHESRAAVSSFCLELQKQLGLRYVAPPLPVNLDIKHGEEERSGKAPSSPATSKQLLEEPRSPGISTDGSLQEGVVAISKLFETKK